MHKQFLVSRFNGRKTVLWWLTYSLIRIEGELYWSYYNSIQKNGIEAPLEELPRHNGVVEEDITALLKYEDYPL